MEDACVVCVVLAAGFGTRLRASLEGHPQYGHLAHTPKPLLPLAQHGTIAELWAAEFLSLPCSRDSEVLLVSNAAHFPLYRSLFSSSSSSSVSSSSVSSRGVRVLDDGALDNERRLGAVADLREAVRHARREPDVLVAVAGDTLFEKSVSVKDLLREFVASNDDALTLGYVMSDPATQCRSRGVLQMDAEGRVVRFAEKPNEPLPNSLASAPLYIYRKTVLPHLNAYLDERKASGAKIAEYDAPGFFLAYLVNNTNLVVRCKEIPGRIDIGSLSDYLEALEAIKNW